MAAIETLLAAVRRQTRSWQKEAHSSFIQERATILYIEGFVKGDMAENAQKQAKSDDVVIPVKSGGHVSMVSLGNAASVRTAPAAPLGAQAAPGGVEKAVSLLVQKNWQDEKRVRLRQFVLSFFSDVRDRLELREDLQSPWEHGGLGLRAEEAGYMVGVCSAVRDGGPLPVRPAEKVPLVEQTPPRPLLGKEGIREQTLPLAKGEPPVPPKAGEGVSGKEFAGKRREEIFAALAKEIVDAVNPQLAGPALRSRLEALIATRFRGVRDANEMRAHMKRDAAQGGLSMASEEIERVMAVVEDRFAKISKELHAQEKGRVLEALKLESSAGRAQRQGTSDDIKGYEVNQWYEKRFEGGAKRETEGVNPPAPAPAPQRTMQDAAYTPTLLGPVEELRSMTLDDFRRVARDPKEAARRIQDKIRLLEEEDYTKRAAAIAAWRGSAPVKAYLGITRAMLEQGIGPEQAVAAQGTGAAALTMEEYNAIMDLQNSLRY